MFPGATPAPLNKQERKLIRLYKRLDKSDRDALLAFAEFLVSRRESAAKVSEAGGKGAQAVVSEPLSIPRPAKESVIKAIKRLSETYPMVEKDNLLHPISDLMTAHMVQGKPAEQVIDELEVVFNNEFNKISSNNNE